jgi:hypothetical protein
MGNTKRAAIAGLALLAAAIPAFAQAPGNDDRGDARQVSVPSTVEGTTREATLQENDPFFSCGPSADSTVWYSFDPGTTQRVSIELSGRGDLESTLVVFRRNRSQLDEVECDTANRQGRAGLTFRADQAERYLIMVVENRGSESAGFGLELFAPEPEAEPPGRRLPARGGGATVERGRDLSDAWSRFLVAGTSYVVTVASRSEACPRVSVYEPGLSSFDGASRVDGSACNTHNLFTPERSGRYSFLVLAGRGDSGVQRYRLRVRRASRDDTAPGNILSNYERARGHVGPRRADVVDLHRFYVRRRSDVTVRFATGANLQLEIRNVRGRSLGSAEGESLSGVLRRGRYYAVVRALDGSGGRYTVRPVVRSVTSTGIAINGRREAVISPGQAATVGVGVRPPAGGRITIIVQRLDPLEGWQFHRRVTRRTSSGRASLTFVPRRPGRFRARAEYSGSRTAAPSATGFAYVSAREPF